MKYMLTKFKVCGFSLFSNEVELNMSPLIKNNTHLTDNLIQLNKSKKVVKSSVIYGGNNSGKSSLLNAIMEMKLVFQKGDLENYKFDINRNFFKKCDKVSFSIAFIHNNYDIEYNIYFKDTNEIGENVYLNNTLFFSRDLNGNINGVLKEENDIILSLIKTLPNNKLVVPFVNEYIKESNNKHSIFKDIKEMFNKIKFIDNSLNYFNSKLFINFSNDDNKMNILNKLISNTSLYMEKRGVISKDELLNNEFYQKIANDKDEFYKDAIEKIDLNRVVSYYKNNNGDSIIRPSYLFDSLGTNKYIYLVINIIESLINNEILLIDEIDSSLHYKLNRALIILMNSTANNKAQFIITTHDIKLMSYKLFRKDQINFNVRENNIIDIIRLDSFKSNSNKDIRSTSNFENMYLTGEIIDLPETNIYNTIEEIERYNYKNTNKKP